MNGHSQIEVAQEYLKYYATFFRSMGFKVVDKHEGCIYCHDYEEAQRVLITRTGITFNQGLFWLPLDSGVEVILANMNKAHHYEVREFMV